MDIERLKPFLAKELGAREDCTWVEIGRNERRYLARWVISGDLATEAPSPHAVLGQEVIELDRTYGDGVERVWVGYGPRSNTIVYSRGRYNLYDHL